MKADWSPIIADKLLYSRREFRLRLHRVYHNDPTVQACEYLQMRPPTDEELSSLPHVFMTSDDKWDPSAVDNDGPDLEGIENHPDVVRIREQQDRRIDDHGDLVELDVNQVVRSPDHEGAVTNVGYIINATHSKVHGTSYHVHGRAHFAYGEQERQGSYAATDRSASQCVCLHGLSFLATSDHRRC